jgi:SAM-dependent methyltransferase
MCLNRPGWILGRRGHAVAEPVEGRADQFQEQRLRGPGHLEHMRLRAACLVRDRVHRSAVEPVVRELARRDPEYRAPMVEDTWAALADRFADGAYASVKGRVRTYVMHRQLLEHLPPPPARVLDVGGGAGHQSFPLARAGYDVTLLDSSPAMLDKARQRLPAGVTFVEADGADAVEAVGGRQFDAVLCHGVLGYLEDPEPVLDQLCRCAAPGGLVSIMTGNADTAAVRPAMERRWEDALASFDTTTEIGVLGLPTRADTVDKIGESLRGRGVETLQWYGVWLFVDWLDLSGAGPDPADAERVAAVEFEAGRRDPYRRLSRVFHLVGRKS